MPLINQWRRQLWRQDAFDLSMAAAAVGAGRFCLIDGLLPPAVVKLQARKPALNECKQSSCHAVASPPGPAGTPHLPSGRTPPQCAHQCCLCKGRRSRNRICVGANGCNQAWGTTAVPAMGARCSHQHHSRAGADKGTPVAAPGPLTAYPLQAQ